MVGKSSIFISRTSFALQQTHRGRDRNRPHLTARGCAKSHLPRAKESESTRYNHCTKSCEHLLGVKDHRNVLEFCKGYLPRRETI